MVGREPHVLHRLVENVDRRQRVTCRHDSSVQALGQVEADVESLSQACPKRLGRDLASPQAISQITGPKDGLDGARRAVVLAGDLGEN
jgi:hypothetical protein